MKKTLFALAVLFSFCASLLAQATFPRFGAIENDGVVNINRSSLGWTKSITLVSLASRGLTFNPRLSYNSFFWLKNQASNGAYAWSPLVDGDGNPTWGWLRQGSPVTESDLMYNVSRYRCVANDGSNQWGYEYYNFRTSTLRFDLDVSLAEMPENYPECGDAGTQQMSAYGRDSGGAPTGYYLVLQGRGGPMPWPYPTWAPPYTFANNNTHPKLFAPGGTQVDMTGSIQDTNGNKATWAVSGSAINWNDSIGRQSLVITNDTTNHVTTYQYPDNTGPQHQTWTFHYSQMNVATAFGCSNTNEYSQNGLYLPTSLDLPGTTNGSYSFTYEQTPGNSGATTGRISKITLPTGGWISFSYSGVNCDDGSPMTMVKTISDGTQSNPPSWTYTRTNNNGTWTTQVDGPSHGELVTFDAKGVPTDAKIYTGAVGGTVLQEVQTSYSDGSPSSITTTTGSVSKQVNYDYTVYGNLLWQAEYDWNSTSTVLRTITNTYIQDFNYLENGLPNLLSSSTVQQGNATGPVVSKTEYFYDLKNSDGSADTDSSNIAMTCQSGASAHDDSNYGCTSITPRGNLTKMIRYSDAANSVGAIKTYYGYDSLGNLVTIKDGRGNQSTISYADNWSGTSNCALSSSAYAYPTLITNALSQTQTLWQNRCTGLTVKSRDPNSKDTTYAYDDALLRPTAVTYPDNSSITPSLQYDYTTTTAQVKTLQSTGSSNVFQTQTTTVDGLRRTTQVAKADPAGDDLVSTSYNNDGRVYQVSNPYRSGSQDKTTYGYDSLGQVTGITLPDNNTITYTRSGNTIVVGGTAASARTLVYDALGNLSQVQEPNPAGGSALLTDYVYNVLGNLTGVNQHGTSSEIARTPRSFSYDSLSRLIKAQTPEAGTTCYGTWSGGSVGSGNCQNGYDGNDNLQYKTDARGRVTTYIYDSLNRLTDKTFSDQTPGQHFQYDANGATYNSIGRLAAIYTDADTRYFGSGTAPSCVAQTSPTSNYNPANGNPAYCTSSAEVYQYDAMGRQTYIGAQFPSERSWTHHETSIGYDLAGNVISLTYPDGRKITPGWDNAGRLLSLTDGGLNGAQVGYSYFSSPNYFPDGSPHSMTYGSGLTETIGKNNRLQVSSITAVGPTGAGTTTLLSKQYCYICNTSGKNNGNIGQISDLLNSSRTQSFTYDNLNRIASFSAGSASQTYSIDSFGNLSQTGTMTSQLSFDSNNRIISGGYGYDPSGNVTSFNNGVTTSTYKYDAENKIFNVNSGGGFYSYDAEGNRARKDAGGTYTEYAYFNGQPIAEKHADGSWSDYVFANGQRIARIDPKTTVTVRFTNDSCSSCGGTSVGGGNRNLYVNSITIGNATFLPGDPSVSYPVTSGCNQNGNNGGVGTLSCTGDMTATNAGGGVITVNAYGSPDYNVYPHMQILINNIVVGEWDVTGSAQNYSIGAPSTVTVRFTNDNCSSCAGTAVGGGDRNLYVNSITIGNTTFLPGDSTVSYPVTSGCNQNHNNNGIGWLTCTGDMAVRNSGNSDAITVNAYGSPDYSIYPHMQVLVNNVVVGEWDVTGTAQNYSVGTTSTVSVRFTNDSCSACGGTAVGGGDRNLYVNSITIGNKTFLPGDSAVSYPVTSGCNQNHNSNGIGSLTCSGDMAALSHADGDAITINAYGSPDYSVYPHMQLLIDNMVVGEWNVTGSAQNYSISAVPPVHYYIADHLGTTSLVLSASNVIESDSSYYPFGKEVPLVADDSNHFKFTGQERDAETGLDYFMHRSYSSTMGRWMSPDPYDGSYDLTNPQSLNRYAYALNNPMRFRDPLGLMICWWGPSDFGGDDYDDDPDCFEDGGTVIGDTTTVTVTDDGSASYIEYIQIGDTSFEIQPQDVPTYVPGPKPWKIHGNYCGPDWTGGQAGPYDPTVDAAGLYKPPTDSLDSSCRTHDICYSSCRQANTCDAESRASCFAKCDRKLEHSANLEPSWDGTRVDIAMLLKGAFNFGHNEPNPASCTVKF